MTSQLCDPGKFLFIAGPCSLETETICRSVATVLRQLAFQFPEVEFVFKGSFDKANRTSISSPRGPGLDDGLALLGLISRDYGLPVMTDVHECCQIPQAAEVCDILQIPAFLCRQTDLLVSAARSGCIVNVKKGQFLSPSEMRFVVQKLEEAGASQIWQTERGTTFGYQNLVVDMRSFAILKEYGHPVIMDATHSVQLPGAGGGKSSGQRQFVPALARAAIAAGADGIFAETHPDPAKAISDGPNQIPLDQLEKLVSDCLKVWQTIRAL